VTYVMPASTTPYKVTLDVDCACTGDTVAAIQAATPAARIVFIVMTLGKRENALRPHCVMSRRYVSGTNSTPTTSDTAAMTIGYHSPK
jgi:hypothetical protein